MVQADLHLSGLIVLRLAEMAAHIPLLMKVLRLITLSAGWALAEILISVVEQVAVVISQPTQIPGEAEAVRPLLLTELVMVSPVVKPVHMQVAVEQV